MVSKKIAVILCGSGFKDGSEIRESVGVLWALSRHNLKTECFAPQLPQFDVINCLTNEAMNEKRNMLVEAARIARGDIRDLQELNPDEFAGIVIPGGFGAAKNLCDFAFKGSQGSTLSLLKEQLEKFYAAGKPIGAVCIAPAIVALSFRDKKFDLSVGPKSEASDEIEKTGHRHVMTTASECCVDTKNKIVTTGAYMHEKAPLCDIFEGIRKLVDEVVKLS